VEVKRLEVRIQKPGSGNQIFCKDVLVKSGREMLDMKSVKKML